MERFFLKNLKDVEVRENCRGYKQGLGANNREKTISVTQIFFGLQMATV